MSRSGPHLCVSRLLHFHRLLHFLRHGFCWWGLGAVSGGWGDPEFPRFPWNFQATFLLWAFYFCMSASVSPFISCIPDLQSSLATAILLNQVTLESWHGFRSSWLATSRKYLAVEQRTAQICESIMDDLSFWMPNLDKSCGAEIRYLSYSLWCMGRMGMVPQLFRKSIHLLSGPQ